MFLRKDTTQMKIIDFCKKYDMLPEHGTVLCAVSGGKDSMCLLDNMEKISEDGNVKLACAHYNHRLRGADADRDEKFVRDYCKEHDIPFFAENGDVSGYANENKIGTEEAARILRYAFLDRVANEIGAVKIATAHTADDNVETMLFNFARGAGLSGLCGIPPVRGKLIRPMLCMTTAEVYAYLEENSIPHVEDYTNAIDDISRNKIRHRVVPSLRELNLRFDDNARKCIDRLREDEALLQSMADKFVDDNLNGDMVDASALSAQPHPISARVLQKICGGVLSEKHIEAILNIASSDNVHASCDVKGMRIARSYDKMVFGFEESAAILPQSLKMNGVISLKSVGFDICCEKIEGCDEIHNSFNNFYFASGSICGNIIVKSREQGDRIRFLGRKCTKSLKKLFSEAKLNGTDKGKIPVLCDENGVIAVYGFGIAEHCAAKKGDDVIKVTITKHNSFDTL